MRSYDILIDYTTGDSFGSNRTPDESLGIVTSDIDKAKENLKRIKDHYAANKDGNDCDNMFRLELLTDDGVRVITPFWVGYFETLHGAKIQTSDDDMSFEL